MSEDTTPTPADWYADPLGRFELRYYDGAAWTEHVTTGGAQSVDPFGTDTSVASGMAGYLVSGDNAAKFTMSAARWQGTGHLFTEPILVVKQHAKFVATSSDYEITTAGGDRLGSVREVGQSQAKQLVRAFTNFDKHLSHTFEIRDASDALMLRLVRPAKLMKSKLTVEDGTGVEVGRIVQKNAVGRIRFELESGGRTLGRIQGRNWRDWDFSIFDDADDEIGRVSKSFEGLKKALFTSADNFVVAMHRPLDDPLRQLVIAAAVCIDVALHEDTDSGLL
jgi:uncharacterized protein YxjI